MIEDDYALGADFVLYELFDVTIKLRTDRRIIVPLRERRAEFAQGETLAVERERPRATPPVVHRHFVRIVPRRPPLRAGRRLVEIDFRLHAGIARIVEGRFDVDCCHLFQSISAATAPPQPRPASSASTAASRHRLSSGGCSGSR